MVWLVLILNQQKELNIFKSVDPYTGGSIKTTVTVKVVPLKADDVVTFENKTSTFTVKVFNQNGRAAQNKNIKIGRAHV